MRRVCLATWGVDRGLVELLDRILRRVLEGLGKSASSVGEEGEVESSVVDIRWFAFFLLLGGGGFETKSSSPSSKKSRRRAGSILGAVAPEPMR